MLAAQEALGGGYGFLPETIGPVADEINAGVSAASDWLRSRVGSWGDTSDDASFGDLYGEYKQIANSEQDAYRKAHPMAALGANLVGAMATGLPGPNALAGAAAPVATNALAAAGQGLKAGAVAGGLTGFAEGEGLTGRLEGATTGAAVGGAIGGAIPLVANLAQRVGGAVRRITGLKGAAAEQRAREMITEALERDGIDLAAVASSGKPLSIADLGPNTRALVGSAGRQGGRGKEAIEDFFEDRTKGQFGRLSDDLAGATGMKGQDFARTGADIIDKRVTQAAADYPAAYRAQPPVLSQNAEDILATPAGKSAVKTAARMMQNKRRPIFDGADNYTVEMLDQIQRAMRDASTSASGQRAGEMAANIDSLRGEFLNELPNELKGAMSNYRARSELLDALNAGREFLKGDAEMAGEALAKMTPQQTALFRLGVARELRGKMGAKIDSGDISGMFQNPQMRERLASIFPSKRLFQDFMESVATERTMQETRNALLKNSATASRMMSDAEFGAGALGEFASDMASGGGVKVGLTKAVMNAALKGKDRYLQGVNEAVAGNVADLATNTDLAAVAQALKGPGGTAVQAYPVNPVTVPAARELAKLAAAGGQSTPASTGWTILPPQ